VQLYHCFDAIRSQNGSSIVGVSLSLIHSGWSHLRPRGNISNHRQSISYIGFPASKDLLDCKISEPCVSRVESVFPKLRRPTGAPTIVI
jgi:hypothetical protein